MDSTQTDILHPKLHLKVFKVHRKHIRVKRKGNKNRSQKKVEEQVVKESVPTKTSRGVLKITKNPTKKPSESKTMKLTEVPTVEIVEPVAGKVSYETVAPIVDTLTKEGEPVATNGVLKRVKKLQFTRRGVVVQKLKKQKPTPVEDKIDNFLWN
ncbi:unnamed protein product [Lactuca saligna]|uniref:Uncharacterized protein n=1 Tax=Lactuca saligna TaxID=75948 RepID=A0AA36EQ39_LACSI|nr:unnamed protein product [Lactuca saligna]